MRWVRTDPPTDRQGYVIALAVAVAATVLNKILAPFVAQTNLVMVYLLGVAFVASRGTPRAGVLVSVLSVAAFDIFFVHPVGTFAVSDVEYLITFAVMLGVSLLISTLTSQVQALAKARSEANLRVQIEQHRSDLLSAVSHDLQTPLASIEGSAEVLAKDPGLRPESRQLATTIREEAVRVSGLVRNLLDMTRVQGELTLDLDWYSLDELAANAILRTEHQFEHDVKLAVAKGTPLLRVDGVLIEQVFVNLLENASRHAGAQAAVRIEIEPDGAEVEASVIDDGPGIPPGMEQKVFERFQKSNAAGFGLGLSICKAVIEAHGGRIEATRPAAGGASLTFHLPIATEGADV